MFGKGQASLQNTKQLKTTKNLQKMAKAQKLKKKIPPTVLWRIYTKPTKEEERILSILHPTWNDEQSTGKATPFNDSTYSADL